MKTVKFMCSSLLAISATMANAGEVIRGTWPIIVVGPVAAKTLPQDIYKEIGTMNDKRVFINISGQTNNPVTGSKSNDVLKASEMLSTQFSDKGNGLNSVIGTESSGGGYVFNPEPGSGVLQVLSKRSIKSSDKGNGLISGGNRMMGTESGGGYVFNPEPGDVSGVLSIRSIAKGNGSSGGDRALGTINLSTIPEVNPFDTSKASGILLLDSVAGSELSGGAGKLSGEIYSLENIAQKLGDISIDINTIRTLENK